METAETKALRFFELVYSHPKSEGSPGTLAIDEFLFPPHPAAHHKLAEKEIPPIGVEFTSELIAVGNSLVGRINDQTISYSLEDGDSTGSLAVFGTNKIPFRDLEVLNLDGLPEAEALKLAGGSAANASASPALPATPSPVPAAAGYPQPTKWIDVTDTVRSAGLKYGSLAVDGEWLVATKTCWPSVTGGAKFGNLAVRVFFANRLGLQLRHSADPSYNAGAGPQGAAIAMYRGPARTAIADAAVGITEAPDTVHELVFAAQGDTLRLWLDGSEVARGKDTSLTTGTAELSLMVDGKSKPPRVKKVEYGELEANPPP